MKLISKALYSGMVCAQLFSFTYAVENVGGRIGPTPIPEGKAQIVIYRSKELTGSGVTIYLYNVTKNLAIQDTQTQDIYPFYKGVPCPSPVDYAYAKKFSKPLGSKPGGVFKAGDYQVFNVEPGMYGFVGTKFNLIDSTPPAGVEKKQYDVKTISVEANKQYFVKASVVPQTWTPGEIELSSQTVLDGYADLDWEHPSAAVQEASFDIRTFSPEKFCSKNKLASDSVRQLIDQFGLNKSMLKQGDQQIGGGTALLLLGAPACIGIGLAIAFKSINDSERKLGEFDPVSSIAPAVGGTLAGTCIISGARLIYKGKSNRRNALYNMNEIKLKLEASCNKVSMTIDF